MVVNNTRIKIYHIITGLGTGGPVMMLYKLLSNIDRGLFAVLKHLNVFILQ